MKRTNVVILIGACVTAVGIRRPGRKVIIEVPVPRRSRKRLWDCPRDIPPDRFRRLITFSELAGASVD
jgi:hypothetical protein